jgi:hypothetical protein
MQLLILILYKQQYFQSQKDKTCNQKSINKILHIFSN